MASFIDTNYAVDANAGSPRINNLSYRMFFVLRTKNILYEEENPCFASDRLSCVIKQYRCVRSHYREERFMEANIPSWISAVIIGITLLIAGVVGLGFARLAPPLPGP